MDRQIATSLLFDPTDAIVVGPPSKVFEIQPTNCGETPKNGTFD
jgi:hypothetical protein